MVGCCVLCFSLQNDEVDLGETYEDPDEAANAGDDDSDVGDDDAALAAAQAGTLHVKTGEKGRGIEICLCAPGFETTLTTD